MRVLFSTTAGSGHFGPLVPFADACRRAGHEVVVAAPASFAGQVSRAGFAHHPFADAPPEEWGAVMARLPQLSYEEAEQVVLAEVFAGVDVRAGLPGVIAAVEELRPDLVVRESAELASHLVAERFALPEIRVGVSLGGLEERYTDTFASALGPVRASLGLDPDVAGDRLRAAPWCTLNPAVFEDPAAPAPAPAHRFRLDPEEQAREPLPAWWPGEMAARPLVYVTFGTVAGTVPHVAAALPAAVEAVGRLPVRVLVTAGEGGDPDALGTVSPNVHVERWVPQARVLAEASVVVCHGGYGTVLGTLTAGVPLVVTPQFADQPYNARRVAEVGAGVALALGPPDVRTLRNAVEMVLAEPAYASVARRVADDIRALPAVDEAVALFEEVAT